MLLSAFAWMNADPASRTYYDRQHARGKTHTQALLRLARQRISVLIAMLRNGTLHESRPPHHPHRITTPNTRTPDITSLTKGIAPHPTVRMTPPRSACSDGSHTGGSG